MELSIDCRHRSHIETAWRDVQFAYKASTGLREPFDCNATIFFTANALGRGWRGTGNAHSAGRSIDFESISC